MGLGTISWLFVGFLVGVGGWLLLKVREPTKILTIECVAIAGAFVGGFLCAVNGIGDSGTMNVFSLAAAALVAALAIFLHHVGSAVEDDD